MEFDYIELFIEMKHWRYCFGNSFCVEFQNTQDKMRDYLLRGDCARASGDSILGTVGAGFFILCLFSFVVSLISLTLWLIQCGKEAVK